MPEFFQVPVSAPGLDSAPRRPGATRTKELRAAILRGDPAAAAAETRIHIATVEITYERLAESA